MTAAPLVPRSVALRDGRSCLLRAERDGDAPGVCALASEVARSEIEVRLSLTALRAEGGFAVVAEAVRVGIVGHLVVGGPRRSDGGGEIAIFVANTWRRGGLGSQMITLGQDWARSIELAELAVRVDLANAAARALYRALGFRPDAGASGDDVRLTLRT